jgi:hypothetical protein
MKHPKKTVLLFAILLFTTCTFQKTEGKQLGNQEDRTNTSIKRDDLIGKWNRISDSGLLKESDLIIESIQYNNDSTADIWILDSIGSRKIVGKWIYGFEKQIGNTVANMRIKSDIKLSFNLNENHSYIVLLKLTEEHSKIVMSGHKNRFEKE